MSCTICGKPTGPGALLCRPCRAALKRARQFTVLEIPGTAPAVTMPGGLPPVTVSRVKAPPAKLLPKRMLAALVAIALLCALLLALYAMEYVSRGHAQTAAPPPTVVAPPAAPKPVPTTDVVPLAIPPRTLLSAKPHVKTPAPEPVTPPPVAATPPEAPPTISASATPATTLQPAPAPVSPPDHWQAMNDALVRCEREGGLAAFVCEQRARVDACDGYWGAVAQCPRPSDYPR